MWKKPIVCVSVDGFYEPFKAMLHRAEEDKLLHCDPKLLVSFAETSEAAVNLVEKQLAGGHGPTGGCRAVGRRRSLFTSDVVVNAGLFALGFVAGAFVVSRRRSV